MKQSKCVYGEGIDPKSVTALSDEEIDAATENFVKLVIYDAGEDAVGIGVHTNIEINSSTKIALAEELMRSLEFNVLDYIVLRKSVDDSVKELIPELIKFEGKTLEVRDEG